MFESGRGRRSGEVHAFPKGLALFGGTFDPVHSGHCLIAQLAWQHFGLERVLFIPCYQSPHKSGVRNAPAEDRVHMLKKALEAESWAEVNEYESEKPGPSYSVETAEHFSRLYPDRELFWIMGTDQWKVLETWKDYRRLADLVTFIVFPRPDPPEPKSGIRHLQLPVRIDISASMVRNQIAEGKPFQFFVPAAVHATIREKGLYT